MSDLDQRPTVPPAAPPAPPAKRRRRRWLRWVLAAVVVAAAVVGVVVWLALRPPKPVSVTDVLNTYRSTQPSAPSTGRAGGPAVGVYVYATKGTERISSGNVTHHYPDRTTLTVTDIDCGLRLRWDALSGRSSEAQLCATSSGWQLTRYTDVHKFLYMKDVHDYTCQAPTPTEDGFTIVCRYSGGEMASTFHLLGTESRTLAGAPVTTRHVRVEQHGTGKSLSEGTTDAWVLPSGIPVHVDVTNHGSQTVLGQRVTYQEDASFDLMSATPRR